MFSLHVPAYGVVPGEGSRAVGTGDPDTLVSLPDVSSEVGLVAVGSLAEGTSKFSAW